MPDILPTDISPATAPAAPAAPEATADSGVSPELAGLLEQDGDIPDEVLRIPAFNALLEGKPAAIYSEIGTKSPELETITKFAPDLIKAGFGFYKADSKPVNVLFNTLELSIEDLAKADSEGRLDEIAAPFADVKGSYDQVIAGGSGGEAEAAATEGGSPTVPGPSPAASPASVQNKIATARTENLTPDSPNRQGKILSALKKPVV